MTSPNSREPRDAFEMALVAALWGVVAEGHPAAAGRRRLLQAAAADQRRFARFWPQWFQHWLRPHTEPTIHLGLSVEALPVWRLDWLTYSRQQLLL